MKLLIAAAIASAGVVATFAAWLEPHLRSGALLPVPPDWWQEFPGMSLTIRDGG